MTIMAPWKFPVWRLPLEPDDEYMKVVADGLLLEVLEDSGKASATGTGDLLVTDLDNTCMPFIRYRLGDRVELDTPRRGVMDQGAGQDTGQPFIQWCRCDETGIGPYGQ